MTESCGRILGRHNDNGSTTKNESRRGVFRPNPSILLAFTQRPVLFSICRWSPPMLPDMFPSQTFPRVLSLGFSYPKTKAKDHCPYFHLHGRAKGERRDG